MSRVFFVPSVSKRCTHCTFENICSVSRTAAEGLRKKCSCLSRVSEQGTPPRCILLSIPFLAFAFAFVSRSCPHYNTLRFTPCLQAVPPLRCFRFMLIFAVFPFRKWTRLKRVYYGLLSPSWRSDLTGPSTCPFCMNTNCFGMARLTVVLLLG